MTLAGVAASLPAVSGSISSSIPSSISSSIPSSMPSPTVGVIHLGPLPLRAYALCILTGIVVAIWITGRRLEQRGGQRTQALDVGAFAVVAGIIGGRLYHVITTPEPYWGEGGHPLDALRIWNGGLGIWGAVALGAVGAWIGCRRHGVGFLDFCDAAAPGVAVAHAIGRWGNWFNNELYGGPTDLPWGLQIHEWDQAAGRAVVDAAGKPVVIGTFHPMFLYEAIFLLLLALVLVLVDRRRRRAPGLVLGLYVAGYPLGRIVFERMRTDPAELVLGQRVNVWTSIVVFLLGLWIIRYAVRHDPAPLAVGDPGDPGDSGDSGEAGDSGDQEHSDDEESPGGGHDPQDRDGEGPGDRDDPDAGDPEADARDVEDPCEDPATR